MFLLQYKINDSVSALYSLYIFSSDTNFSIIYLHFIYTVLVTLRKSSTSSVEQYFQQSRCLSSPAIVHFVLVARVFCLPYCGLLFTQRSTLALLQTDLVCLLWVDFSLQRMSIKCELKSTELKQHLRLLLQNRMILMYRNKLNETTKLSNCATNYPLFPKRMR